MRSFTAGWSVMTFSVWTRKRGEPLSRIFAMWGSSALNV